MLREELNDFNITLEGEINSIDVNILTTTLQNFNILIQEINREVNPEVGVSFQIQTFRSGSFDIFCCLLGDENALSTLFNILKGDNFETAVQIIQTLADILAIKQFLGGKKPKSVDVTGGDSIIITNQDGQVKLTSQKAGDIIFNNSTVNITINKTFRILKDIGHIKGLAIKDNQGNHKFRADRDQFENLYSATEIIEVNIDSPKTISKYYVSLSVFKIVFKKKYKWDFYHEGVKISATIEDSDFYEKLLSRQIQFMNGDILVVDLDIVQVFNQVANTFENKKYIVRKIHEIQHQSKQAQFDFDND